MRSLRIIILLSLSFFYLLINPNFLLAGPFSVTFNWADSFRIYGYQPVPQINGFDYYFSPEQTNINFAGSTINVHSIEVSGFGNNLGNIINFDWEVHLSGNDLALPEGQFTKTLIDPVSGYSRTAETRFMFVIGNHYDKNSYLFRGSYDFMSNGGKSYPYLSTIRQATTQQMTLNDGLHVQLFLWTADNRNSQIQFDNLSLTVTGEATPRVVPEPISFVLFIIGGVTLASRLLLRKKMYN